MDYWPLLSKAILLLIVVALLILPMLLMKEWRKMQAEQKEVQLAQIRLLDKTVGLLSASDVIAFQGIQAVNPEILLSPSETSDAPRFDYDALIEKDRRGERLTDDELAFIDEQNFGPN